MTMTEEGVPYAPVMCEMNVDALRQIRSLLRRIQSPVVAYDNDTLTMVKSAVGYCAEMAMQIETLLPLGGDLEPAATYTWADHQAANKAALDEIAAFVGGNRE